MPIPILTSTRLLLRPFKLEDVETVVRLAGNHRVADTTLNIPYPYTKQDAIDWINQHEIWAEMQTALSWALSMKANQKLIGAISLSLNKRHQKAELGYWLGIDYWNQGYMTEAARAVLEYAFNTLHLNRVEARHMTRNPASGKVMQKLGMHYEGTQASYFLKNAQFEDISNYGLLKAQWQQNT